MRKTTVKGMNEYLPEETELRDYLQQTILATYKSCGFQRITTPIMEDIENLKKSEGGENLELLFEVMKRGDKLKKSIENKEYNRLTDMGLRYDLTLPLTRYYSNNRDKLMNPFRCIQMDRVYRAERPQKGRLREFVQCDIDIIGQQSNVAEIELITTTAKALQAIGINAFAVRINDRRLLQMVLLQIGFKEEELESVCITLDKLDKIGSSGVEQELKDKGISVEIQERFLSLLNKMPLTITDVAQICKDSGVIDNIETIMKSVQVVSQGKYNINYDFTLVRGQGYYTGTIFEITSSEFRGAIAGGGRYDNLIGKFTGGNSIPAVGFSIGFERIYGILKEKGYKIPTRNKVAVVYEENAVVDAIQKAELLRADADVFLVVRKKNYYKQLELLRSQGIGEVVEL
ncbi:histidine--tRNA ligase [Anaerosporobacter sp.]|uniref:histidine--tRNA ligase n=1 Tax=Anaerosporobacter sp. TaxID=1872529 RepID=UPI00286EE909|nr:histidine--tRNA ligase [Anaerosporobacter sp.]